MWQCEDYELFLEEEEKEKRGEQATTNKPVFALQMRILITVELQIRQDGGKIHYFVTN
jgi:hypothetical protein